MKNCDGVKIYIVEKCRSRSDCDIIATFDCSCISDVCDFESLFENPVDFYIDIDYDNHLYYTYLQDVVHFLKEVIKDREKLFGKGNIYRRLKPLYKLVKSFNNERWISDKMKNHEQYYGTDGYDMLVVCQRYSYNEK
jgi:hypothetical protein